MVFKILSFFEVGTKVASALEGISLFKDLPISSRSQYLNSSEYSEKYIGIKLHRIQWLRL